MENLLQYEPKELLVLLKQDSSSAFTRIYNRYWKQLFAIAYNRLNEIETAEDIVHDVFSALWANRHKVQIDTLENYLAAATKYMVLNRLRKLERERMYNTNLHATPVVDISPESLLHYKRILEIVKQEVDNLPERCKLIFAYSRNEGMATKQIAQKLNISPKTVENQLSKAIKSIKAATRSFTISVLPAVFAILT
ncbi:MAG: RNA polymerase sigma-70 factor [Chitinophagaceae bacterium]|nr:RNA polymerase sigma-70 factor [Chitinophagaceae bacterium]MCW5928982.1 RNA polymerase sigma-70 factor [Chitinophagaceae bacterium]